MTDPVFAPEVRMSGFARSWRVWPFVTMALVTLVGSIGGVMLMQRHYHYHCWSWWC